MNNIVKLSQLNNPVYDENAYNTGLIIDRLDQITDILNEAMLNSPSKKIVYINSYDDKVISEREVIIKNMEKILEQMEENYDDIIERLDYFCMIKDSLKKLKCVVNKNTNKYYYRTCIILHDSIVHLKSEKVSLEQFEVIKYLLSKLNNIDIDREEFNEIDSILLENDLDWIPECDIGDDD